MRISVTLLESFRRYQVGLLSEAQLVARVKGMDAPTLPRLTERAS